jgi:hypothetical protein
MEGMETKTAFAPVTATPVGPPHTCRGIGMFVVPLPPSHCCSGSRLNQYLCCSNSHEAHHWMWLAREPGAGSGEQGKRERGAGIVVRNPKIDKFYKK